MESIIPITYALLAVLFGFYFTYYVICKFYSRKRKVIAQDRLIDNDPKVSIILPVYNEVNVLKRRVENFNELHYPQDKLDIGVC